MNASDYLPLYSNAPNINETLYFNIFDSESNYYYIGNHLFAENVSQGVYNITWNPFHSMEYYYESQYAETEKELNDLYEYYQPFIDRYNYLYISWSDENAWKEWRTIEQPNVNTSSIEVCFDYYNNTTEEYRTVYYNQTLNEFETRQIAVEHVYPYNADNDTWDFELSQNYTKAQNLEILSIEGYYFDETNLTFNLEDSQVLNDNETIRVKSPSGDLSNFQLIVVLISFSEGAYSDYTQLRLLDNALNNHNESQLWSKNDSLWVEFEYSDLDYYILFEDYDIGSEDSMFEYINYTRNDKYAGFEDGDFSLSVGSQANLFEPFVEVNDPKTVLEFYDFNLDAEYELVIQRDDIVGNGVYDSFKYGFVDPAGEILFHTVIQRVWSTQLFTDVENEEKSTVWYNIDPDLKDSGYDISAQKSIETRINTVNKIDRYNILIQKDINRDGEIDKELAFEFVASNTFITTLEEEKTELKIDIDQSFTVQDTSGAQIKVPFGTYYISLEELRESTYSLSDSVCSFLFRDFEDNYVVSARYYEDSFPNEISDVYNVDNYAETFSRVKYGVTTVVEAPALEGLLSLSHDSDNVPAIFDSKTTVKDGIFTTENVLSSLESIIMPGTSGGISGEEIEFEGIKVTPIDGVWYDNSLELRPEKIDGSYVYIDGDNDANFETIIVKDSRGDVIGIGLDYDGNSYLMPNKRNLVESHLVKSDASGDKDEDWVDLLWETVIENELVDFHEDEDSFDGYYLEKAFSDSLFDLWKISISGGASKLIKEVEKMTADKFIEEMYWERLVEDVAWQVYAQVSCVALAAMVSTFYGPAGPIVFAVSYAMLQIQRQLKEHEELQEFIKAYNYTSKDYEGKEVLNDRWDKNFVADVVDAIYGKQSSYSVPVRTSTGKYDYEGCVVLMLPEFEDWFPIDDLVVRLTSWIPGVDNSYRLSGVNYALQTRDYMSWSNNIYSSGSPEFFDPKELGKCTTAYLEREILETTKENDDVRLDKIIPYMVGNVPILTFVDSKGGLPAPEFYQNYPIFVSEENYNDGLSDDDPTNDRWYYVCKNFKEDQRRYQVVPNNYPWEFKSEISDVVVISNVDDDFKTVCKLSKDDYSFNKNDGFLTLDSDKCDDLESKLDRIESKNPNAEYVRLVLVVLIDKYQIIEDVDDEYLSEHDLSEEEVEKIATMQSIHASILEYLYQYVAAEDTEQRLQELAYTIYTTAISTAISLGITAPFTGSTNVLTGVLEEVFEETMIDPALDALVGSIAEKYGATEEEKIIWTTLAETTRETVGPVGRSTVNQYRASQLNSMIEKISIQERTGDLKEFQSELHKEDLSEQEIGKKTVAAISLAFFKQATSKNAPNKFLSSSSDLAYDAILQYCEETGLSLKKALKVAKKIVKGSTELSDSQRAIAATIISITASANQIIDSQSVSLLGAIDPTKAQFALPEKARRAHNKKAAGNVLELALESGGSEKDILGNKIKSKIDLIDEDRPTIGGKIVDGGFLPDGVDLESSRKYRFRLSGVSPDAAFREIWLPIGITCGEAMTIVLGVFRTTPYVEFRFIYRSEVLDENLRLDSLDFQSDEDYLYIGGKLMFAHPPTNPNQARGPRVHPSIELFDRIKSIIKKKISAKQTDISRNLGLGRKYLGNLRSSVRKMLDSGTHGVIDVNIIDSIEFNILNNPFFSALDTGDVNKILTLLDEYRIWAIVYDTKGKSWRYRPHRSGYSDIDIAIRKKMSLLRELQASYTDIGSKICDINRLGEELYGSKEAIIKRFYQNERDSYSKDISVESYLNALLSVITSATIIDKRRALVALYDYGYTVYGFDPKNSNHRLILILMYVLKEDPHISGRVKDDLFSITLVADLISSTSDSESIHRTSFANKITGSDERFYKKSIEKIQSAIGELISDPRLKKFANAYLSHYKKKYGRLDGSIRLKPQFILDKDYSNKLTNKDLVDYLSLIAEKGEIPASLLSEDDRTSATRVSSFNRKLTYIDSNIKSRFIIKLLRTTIKSFGPNEGKGEFNFINDLIEYSKSKRYMKDLILGHGSPPHEVVLPTLVQEKSWAIACETPVFLTSDDLKGLQSLIGHIDLLIVKDGVLYVCDYKPDQQYNSRSPPSKSFVNSVPQIATYALILKKMFKLKSVKCVVFNQKGAWLYDPEATLQEITTFMEENGETGDLPWIPYMPYFT